MKKIYKISGMHCDSCATMIELDLEDAGIESSCSYINQTLEVKNEHSKKQIAEIVKNAGYDLIS